MLVVPTDNNPFKWSEIHSLAKTKLDALDQVIRAEARACSEPLPVSGGARHQFFVLLAEQAENWATRAKAVYLECLAQIGREPSFLIKHKIWENGLKYFVEENLRECLILACGIAPRELKWAQDGSSTVHSTPREKDVIRTLSDIDRLVQDVSIRAFVSINQTDNWLVNMKNLMSSLPASEQEDTTFVTGRAPTSRAIEPADQPTPAQTPRASSNDRSPERHHSEPSQHGDIEHADGAALAATRKQALLLRLATAVSGASISYADAAAMCDVHERTIRNWIDEGQLERGAKRGRVTAASIKQKLKIN